MVTGRIGRYEFLRRIESFGWTIEFRGKIFKIYCIIKILTEHIRFWEFRKGVKFSMDEQVQEDATKNCRYYELSIQNVQSVDKAETYLLTHFFFI